MDMEGETNIYLFFSIIFRVEKELREMKNSLKVNKEIHTPLKERFDQSKILDINIITNLEKRFNDYLNEFNEYSNNIQTVSRNALEDHEKIESFYYTKINKRDFLKKLMERLNKNEFFSRKIQVGKFLFKKIWESYGEINDIFKEIQFLKEKKVEDLKRDIQDLENIVDTIILNVEKKHNREVKEGIKDLCSNIFTSLKERVKRKKILNGAKKEIRFFSSQFLLNTKHRILREENEIKQKRINFIKQFVEHVFQSIEKKNKDVNFIKTEVETVIRNIIKKVAIEKMVKEEKSIFNQTKKFNLYFPEIKKAIGVFFNHKHFSKLIPEKLRNGVIENEILLPVSLSGVDDCNKESIKKKNKNIF